MWNAKLDESQTGIKFAGRNISSLRYADDTTLMAESEEKLKNLLMKVKEESEKAVLKLNWKKENHGIWSYHFMANKWGKCGNCLISFSWAPQSMWMVTAARKLKEACSLEECYDKPSQCIKKQSHHFADKDLNNQSYGFPSSYVWMWEFDPKESWTLKNWCFWAVVLENTLESPLDSGDPTSQS